MTSDNEPKPRAADPVVKAEQKQRTVFVEPTLAAVDALTCDSVAVALCEDVRPLAGVAAFLDWRMCGALSELVRRGLVTGKRGEKVLVPTLGRITPVRVFLFGWGKKDNVTDGATDRLRWMIDVLHKAKVDKVAFALPEPSVPLIGLVDEHIKKPLGDRLACLFGPDELLLEGRDTRPLPAMPHTNPM